MALFKNAYFISTPFNSFWVENGWLSQCHSSKSWWREASHLCNSAGWIKQLLEAKCSRILNAQCLCRIRSPGLLASDPTPVCIESASSAPRLIFLIKQQIRTRGYSVLIAVLGSMELFLWLPLPCLLHSFLFLCQSLNEYDHNRNSYYLLSS